MLDVYYGGSAIRGFEIAGYTVICDNGGAITLYTLHDLTCACISERFHHSACINIAMMAEK